MRIGILTFHYCYNYGALLQAYASKRYLETLGVEVWFPDYLPDYFRKSISPFREWRRNWGVMSGQFWKMLPFTIRLKMESMSRRRVFEGFRKQHIPRISYAGKNDLACDVANYDGFWVGSDQVWNLNWMKSFDGFYYLDFIPSESNCRRIGYAPCFGRKDQPLKLLEQAVPLISKFDSIGARNAVTRDLVREKTGRDVTSVCDPTLLWDFKEFIQPNTDGDYILIYSLDKALFPLGGELVAYYKKFYNCKVIQLLSENAFTSPDVDRRACDAGPAEWVSLIYNAKFVVTDSFHACLFALKFQKKFAVYSSGWRKMRLVDILKRVQLENRLILDKVGGADLAALTENPDFTAFSSFVSKITVDSQDFIKNALH